MSKFKKPRMKLQAWEEILREAYGRGALSKELTVKLQARGMDLTTPSEPPEAWEVVVEPTRMPSLPLPPPVAEEAIAEDTRMDQKTADPDTPPASSTVEEGVERAQEEDLLPDGDDQKAQEKARETVEVEVAGREGEGQGGHEWGREGYGICIGCADMYILRCDGEESPWARGSDQPEERDGKFLMECGDCESQGGGRRTVKRKGGFGGFGGSYEDVGGESGRREVFGQIGLSPRVLEGAERAVIANVVRGREVPFVTVRGGVAFVEMGEVLRRLPKGAEVGKIEVDLYGLGQREGLIGRGIG